MLIETIVLLFFLVASLYLAYQFRSCGQQMKMLHVSNFNLTVDLDETGECLNKTRGCLNKTRDENAKLMSELQKTQADLALTRGELEKTRAALNSCTDAINGGS